MKIPYSLNWKKEWIAPFFIILSVIASFYFYTHFPEQVPTHWNFQGQPDDWSGKTFAAFFFPLLVLMIYLLMIFLPLLDPWRSRYQEFSKVYQIIRLSLVVFMTLLYFFASANGLGYNIPIGTIVPLGVGILFLIIGNYLPKVKKNWFVGIRTPWTLASEEVWNKTHRVGGKIFMLAGLVMIFGVWLPEQWYLWLFSINMCILIFGTTGYSWFVWKKIKKN